MRRQRVLSVSSARAGRLALGALVALAAACQVTAPRIWVRGLVVDPDSLRPLPGVNVKGREGSASTDAQGRYELRVPAGVRELTFEAPDRPAARKFVVIDRPVDQRLDALLPAVKPAEPGLAVNRSYTFADSIRESAEVEAGRSSDLSIHDRFGNDDRFLRWKNDGVPMLAGLQFSPDGRSLYVGMAIAGLESKVDVQAGVYRYDLQTDEMHMLPRLDRFDVGSLALSPDGVTLLAGTNAVPPPGEAADLLVIHQPAGEQARAELKKSPVPGGLHQLAFDRGGNAYVVHDTTPTGDRRSVRVSWPQLTVDASWSEGGGSNLTDLVPLSDGSVLGRGDGVYLRKPDGSLSKLVAGPLEPVGLDAGRGVLYYRAIEAGGDHLHWRHLASGLDLRIVTSVRKQPAARL